MVWPDWLLDVFTVNGKFNEWSPWSACSVTCGIGKKNRTRTCNAPEPQFGGKSCTEQALGPSMESTQCYLMPCPGMSKQHQCLFIYLFIYLFILFIYFLTLRGNRFFSSHDYRSECLKPNTFRNKQKHSSYFLIPRYFIWMKREHVSLRVF